MSQDNVIRIPPLHYIHVLDQNSQITRLEGPGPLTFIRQEHEIVKEGPTKMIILNTGKYCRIKNPVQYENNKLVLTEFKQVKNNFGEFEIRTFQTNPEPFPLYPNEQLVGQIETQEILLQDNALKVKALRDFYDEEKKVDRIAGQEWLIFGPLVFTPRIEIQIVQKLTSQVIKQNQALKLVALNQTIDNKKQKREVGEEWLVRDIGNYMPTVDEQVVSIINGQVLTDQVCLCLKAKKNFVDVYGIKRKAGQMWLVTNQTFPSNPVHILDVNEEQVSVQNALTLKANEYCKIIHPFNSKTQTNDWGQTILRKGEITFFLLPGEELVGNIEKNQILLDDEVLLLQAILDFKDEQGNLRKAGEKWMINGPREYIPPIEVKIIESRKSIPLGDNEGIYIRDIKTGKVKTHTGKTYLLQAHEELWDKHLPLEVECLLAEAATGRPFIPPQFAKDYKAAQSKRIKSQIVKYQVQGNNCVQLYDYENEKQRIVFGPEVIILEPDEMFTVLTLSGGRPKKEDQIKTLALNLGPDFMADMIVVETSDHAQLNLTLSYNWHFQIDKKNPDDYSKIFSVKDFVGDVCKQIASRVRGAVSGISFEDFHNNSAQKIQEAVFGKNPDGSLKKILNFKQNNMVVSSVDIQNIEITEQKTREYLQKSINQAIEISTRSSEQQAENEAKKLEEVAKGKLEIQMLEDKAISEASRVTLLELQNTNQSIVSKGKAVSVAKAVAEKEKILGEARVKQITLVQQTEDIRYNQELEEMKAQQQCEYDLKKDEVDFEIQKSKIKADTETTKFKNMVASIGQDTLVAISKAGPELKAKLLKGLGLTGYLVTDGKNPVNLFNTANGFLGSGTK